MSPLSCCDAAAALLAVPQGDWPERDGAWSTLQSLHRLRWPWAPALADRIAKPREARALAVLARCPNGRSRRPARRRARSRSIRQTPLTRLADLTGHGAEERPGQRAYAAAATDAFAPRATRDAPNMVLAEAGTGIGKTLGYLAPASLWAEQAGGAVWVSTFTKALQRQLGTGDARGCSPTRRCARPRWSRARAARITSACSTWRMRCRAGSRAARRCWRSWSRAGRRTRADGDMVGGDLPGWLPTLFRRNGSTALTDRRGECVYAGCPHYRKCFIERAARASARGRHRHRQSCAGDGQRGARPRIAHPPDPLRLRRGPSSLRRGRRDVFDRADRRRRRSSSGAGSSAPKGSSRGRRRGLAGAAVRRRQL